MKLSKRLVASLLSFCCSSRDVWADEMNCCFSKIKMRGKQGLSGWATNFFSDGQPLRWLDRWYDTINSMNMIYSDSRLLSHDLIFVPAHRSCARGRNFRRFILHKNAYALKFYRAYCRYRKLDQPDWSAQDEFHNCWSDDARWFFLVVHNAIRATNGIRLFTRRYPPFHPPRPFVSIFNFTMNSNYR